MYKTTDIREFVKEAIKFMLVFVAVVLIGYMLLVIVYTLPTDVISRHVQESSVVFQSEAAGQLLISGEDDTKLDNFTDSIMLLIAQNEKSQSIWKEAINANHITAEGINPNDIIAMGVGKDIEYSVSSYPRYWHGYLIYLKPLLLLFNYQQIRYLLIFADMALTTAAVYLMGKKNKASCIIPFMMAVFIINPTVCSLSLQYTPIFILTMLQFIIIMLFEDKYRENIRMWIYHFFIVGCLTVYLDFLTYPLVTLGLPVAFMVSQYSERIVDGLKRILLSGMFWTLGYGMMWASKWILGTVITGTNVISNAKEAVVFRSSSGYDNITFTAFDVIKKNIETCRFQLIISLLIFAVYIFMGVIRRTLKFDNKIILLIFIGLFPFVWYSVLKNHSYIHSWMTYRDMSILVYSLLTIGTAVSMKNKKKVIDT